MSSDNKQLRSFVYIDDYLKITPPALIFLHQQSGCELIYRDTFFPACSSVAKLVFYLTE